MLFVIMFIKIRLNYISMPGVWFRALCDVRHRHNRDRAADSLSDKGNRLGRLGLPDHLINVAKTIRQLQ